MALADSVHIVCEDPIRRFQGRSESLIGKICKGHAVASAPSSIPSKYQTIITDNSDKEGFLSKTKRFNYDNLNDHPGPGAYVGLSSTESDSASFSKRGTGMLPSKTKRISQWYAISCSPGPAKYSLQQDRGLGSQNDFNRCLTSVFHHPIAQRCQAKDTGPAPNQYDVLRNLSSSCQHHSSYASAGSSFKSKSKREILDLREAITRPAPDQYSINDGLLRHSVRTPMSSFLSSTGRAFPPKPLIGPGPGKYRPYEPPEPVTKTTFPHHHILCLSAPALPPPANHASPGPGAYEPSDTISQLTAKDAKPTASFVSKSKRWEGDAKKNSFPSPAHYSPQMPEGRQSFFYNANSKWC